MEVKVGLFGLGSVGRGVVTILRSHPTVKATFVCLVRSAKPDRLTAEDHKCQDIALTTNKDDIMKDPKIDIVVEVLGGADGVAWEVVKWGLETDKRVVTANKALLAKHGAEIEELLTTHKSSLRFEASVGASIPILSTLRHFHSRISDPISRIRGVINGSTNYLLNELKDGKAQSMKEVVDKMMSMGYLEADPATDLDGLDARHKLCVLTRMSLGAVVTEADCLTLGLPALVPEDSQFADSQGQCLRLMASASLSDKSVCMMVAPTLIPKESDFGPLPGAMNCIQIEASYAPTISLKGSGAGSLPTGHAVVADMLELLETESQDSHTRSIYPVRRTDLHVLSAEEQAESVKQKMVVRVPKEKAIAAEAALRDLNATQMQDRANWRYLSVTGTLSQVTKALVDSAAVIFMA